MMLCAALPSSALCPAGIAGTPDDQQLRVAFGPLARRPSPGTSSTPVNQPVIEENGAPLDRRLSMSCLVHSQISTSRIQDRRCADPLGGGQLSEDHLRTGSQGEPGHHRANVRLGRSMVIDAYVCNRLDAGQCHRECTTRIAAGHIWLGRLSYRSDELNELCGIGIAHQFDITARRLLVQSSRIAQHHGRARAIASSYHAGRAEHFRPHVVTVRSGKLASGIARAPLSNVITTIAVSSSPEPLKYGATDASAVSYTSTGSSPGLKPQQRRTGCNVCRKIVQGGTE